MKKNGFSSLAGLVLSSILCLGLSGMPLFAQLDFTGIPEKLLEEHGTSGAGQKSPLMQTSFKAEVGLTSSEKKWAVILRSRMGREHPSLEMKQLKEAKMALKLASIGREVPQKKSVASSPSIGTNFEGNWSLTANPPDNTIAVSNGGKIVSANNDGVEYYDLNGNLLYFDFWSDFFNDPQLTAAIFDPVVTYDSQADRFVMVLLHGFQSSESQVLVAFSKSNNPQDGWNYYGLTGNPLNNNCWFDYPKLGISNDEIYVTGNLYDNNNNFNQSVIYQIEKSQGYSGNASLSWQHWYNLNSQPFTAFTLVPTSNGHQGNIGPGMLFLSSEPGGESRIRIWELTDYIGNNPALNVYVTNVTNYSPPGDALMPNTNITLDNSDCRILSAFYLNQVLHYVMHSDVGQGWNGIHYNRLNLNTLVNQTATLGLPGVEDYSFPVAASFATQATDPSVMIAFLRSSQNLFPSTSVVKCDANLQWSQPVEIKAGTTHVDFLPGNRQRWGDYNGMSRKHNSSSPQVWSATSYATDIITPAGTVPNTYKTWIAQINAGGVSLPETEVADQVQVYPIPVIDWIHIDFNLEARAELKIEVMDIQGRPVKLLYQGIPKAGENRLSFNKGALPSGAYFVSIKTENEMISYEKILVGE